MSHQLWGTIVPNAYCWQAMDFHRILGLVAFVGVLPGISYRRILSWAPQETGASASGL
jgi:hypothetical protein